MNCAMQPTIWFYADDIVQIITKWPRSTTVTPDMVPLHFIKRIVPFIAYPLEFLFNLSYITGEVPRRWKHSFVVPVPKKPPLHCPLNYRPVSITSVFARVFEKIVKRKLVDYFHEQELFPNSQHGFCRGKSTETALLCTFNDWTKAYDNKKTTHVIYFDFSKAFDRVPTNLLLKNLSRLGSTTESSPGLLTFYMVVHPKFVLAASFPLLLTYLAVFRKVEF